MYVVAVFVIQTMFKQLRHVPWQTPRPPTDTRLERVECMVGGVRHHFLDKILDSPTDSTDNVSPGGGANSSPYTLTTPLYGSRTFRHDRLGVMCKRPLVFVFTIFKKGKERTARLVIGLPMQHMVAPKAGQLRFAWKLRTKDNEGQPLFVYIRTNKRADTGEIEIVGFTIEYMKVEAEEEGDEK